MSSSSPAWTIALVFDHASERRVRGFWTELSNHGLIAPNVGRPHLTVGRIAGDDLERTSEILADLSESVGGARIAVDSIGVFTGDSPVLFLNPVPNGALLSLHRRAHAMRRKRRSTRQTRRLPVTAREAPAGQTTQEQKRIRRERRGRIGGEASRRCPRLASRPKQEPAFTPEVGPGFQSSELNPDSEALADSFASGRGGGVPRQSHGSLGLGSESEAAVSR